MTNKIGTLIIDLTGPTLLPEEKEMLAHPLIGGVILFTRNYESFQQLNDLCHQIRHSRRQTLLIMVDQEGGRVQRFISEFTRLPHMAEFGHLYHRHPQFAYELTKESAWLMAHELLAANIDLSLAPVLDLNKGVSHVIGNRAFHADTVIVSKLANAFIKGMNEAGMASTGKHFPGHGSITLDSHVSIAKDLRSFNVIKQEDLLPFANLIKAGITAMMASHIIFPDVDDVPVGFSAFWIKKILRSQLNFNGPIMTDDLNMEGANISLDFSDRVLAARDAGCDFSLLCNNKTAVVQVLDTLPYQQHLVEKSKWHKLQGNFPQRNKILSNNERWIKARELLTLLPKH